MSKQPRTLAKFFGVKRAEFRLIKPSEFAHVIIDAQRAYCDPTYKYRRGNAHTKRRCTTLARVTPLFRQTGARTAYVYFDNDLSKDFLNAGGGPYQLQVHRKDIKIPKNDDSAFKGSNIEDIINAHNLKGIIVSGFNTGACVKQTVIDGARAGVKVAVMRDAVGNDNYNSRDTASVKSQLEDMESAGAKITTYNSALNFLSSLGPQ